MFLTLEDETGIVNDLNALKAMVLSREAENARLRQIIKELLRHRFVAAPKRFPRISFS